MAPAAPENPAATDDRARYVALAALRAHVLYDGVATPHRSCGVALAETFGLPTRSYQALRRGGITGEGACGSISAGVLVLGEILGDPSPTGPVTADLREAVSRYRALVAERVDRSADLSCNERTSTLGSFAGPDRHCYCTALTATVAGAVATVLWDLGRPPPLPTLETP